MIKEDQRTGTIIVTDEKERYSVEIYIKEPQGPGDPERPVLGITVCDHYQSPGDPPTAFLSKELVAELIGELTLLWKKLPA